MMKVSLVFVLCISVFSEVAFANELQNVIQSLEKYLKYQLDNKNEMTGQHVLSIRALEGTVLHLIEAAERGELTIDPYLVEDLHAMKVDIKVLTALTTAHMDKIGPDEIAEHWNMFIQPWKTRKPYRLIDPQYRWSGERREIKNPARHFSDMMECVTQLLKRHKALTDIRYQRVDNKRCLAPDMMLAEHTDVFDLKLQLQYFLCAEMYASAELSNAALSVAGIRGGLDEMFQKLCTNAFYLTQDGLADQSLQNEEAYLELTFYCGSLGYMQFVHAEWLEQILSWQAHEGCFISPSHTECSSAFTSASVSALSQYLTLLALPGPLDYQSVVSLHGVNYLRERRDVDPAQIAAINGPLADVRDPPLTGSVTRPTPLQRTEIPRFDKGSRGIGTTAMLGVVLCVVLVLITMYFLCTRDRRGHDSWSLPLTTRAQKWD